MKVAMIDYRDIPLQPGEVERVIIIKHNNSSITTITKGKDKPMTISETIGLIEMSKIEILYNTKLVKTNTKEEMVEIVLDHIDKEIDTKNKLEKLGMKLNQPYMVTQEAADIRSKEREKYIKSKRNSN